MHFSTPGHIIILALLKESKAGMFLEKSLSLPVKFALVFVPQSQVPELFWLKISDCLEALYYKT